jgi:tripartite-type tricarboxylate transporter receptor subunit TctC
LNSLQGSLAALIIAAFGSVAPAPVCSQGYPTRPLRIIVPTSPGAGSDYAARLISQPLSVRLGQQVIVDNRPGGGTMIGSEIVARSRADGYTLLTGGPSLAINPLIYKSVPYDALRDFAPITQTISQSLVLVVHPSLPAKSVKELIVLAKARPGDIVFGSAGQGSGPHLSMELFLLLSGTRMLHVPYKGPAQAIVDLTAGRLSVQMFGIANSGSHIRAGRLRALGVTGAERLASLPDIPTIAEAGLTGYESTQWSGLLAPAGTPQDIISRLNREVTEVLNAQDIRERLAREDVAVMAGSPENFVAHIRAESAKWAKVVKSAGIQPE